MDEIICIVSLEKAIIAIYFSDSVYYYSQDIWRYYVMMDTFIMLWFQASNLDYELEFLLNF